MTQNMFANGGVQNAEDTFVADAADLANNGSQVQVYSRGVLVKQGTVLTGETLVIYNSMFISSGGTANNTVNSEGSMFISSGGVANNTNLIEYGGMYISYGGAANNTTIDSRGYMYISSAGTANSTTINSNGYMYILNRGTANNTTITSYGSMRISSGGTANHTIVNSWGTMLVSTGGTANSTTVNLWGQLNIYSGGTANNTVNAAGNMAVSSGGTANSTIVKSLGNMFIYSGALADYTIVNSGYMYIRSGGMANGTTVSAGGDVDINGGGTANNTTVNHSGEVAVSSGGTANSTTVNSGGCVYNRGGAVNNTTINSSGYMSVSSGGTANSTTVNSVGSMRVDSGATATNIVVKSGGCLEITVAPDTYIQGTVNGSAFEVKNAFLERYTVNYGGGISIDSGGSVNCVVVNSGYMTISSGGTANSTTVNSGGYVDVYKGTASNTTVNFSGEMDISSGGTANSTIVNSGGYVEIYSGCTMNNGTVRSGGILVASNGRMTGDIVLGGTIILDDANDASGADIYFDISERTASDSYILNNMAYLSAKSYSVSISASPAAGTYKLAQGASAFTGSITICNPTTCFGTLTVNGTGLTYGGMTYTLVQSSGNLQLVITSGGSARPDDPPVSSGGSQVKVYSSGTLVKQGTVLTGETIVSGSNNSMYVSSGGTANNTTIIAGRLYVSSGGTVNSTTVNSSSFVYVSNGGKANSTTVNTNGYMYIYGGGTANSTTVNSSSVLRISSGGVANDTTVNSGGYMYIYLDGVANNTKVEAGGSMWISSGGIVSNAAVSGITRIYGSANDITVYSNGFVDVWANGNVSSAVMSGGEIQVSNGGYLSDVNMISGYDTCINLYSGGTINNVSLGSGGHIYLRPNASATGIVATSGAIIGFDVAAGSGYLQGTVNGNAFEVKSSNVSNYSIYSGCHVSVCSGGTAANTSVLSAGRLYILSGGLHKGTLQLDAGCTASAYSGATIDFTVSGRSASDGYLINNLALLWGAPTYTITVSADQAEGTYKLAQGASSFTGSITICNPTSCFGSLVVNGDALTYEGKTYSLVQNNGDLTLSITGTGNTPEPEQPEVIVPEYKWNIVGNFKDGNFIKMDRDGVWTIYGASGRTQIAGGIPPTSWYLIGAGDFDKDGFDGLLWQEAATGYVYMQNDLSDFDEIINKTNCLGVVGPGYQILATGDFTGTGIAGAILQGPAFGDASISLNYGLPVWGREVDGTTFSGWLGALVNTWQPGDALKGDTSDLADVNANNYMYKVISVGDYNGDGVDDVMLQNIMPKTVDGVTITGSGDVFTFLTGDMAAVKAGADPTVAYAGCATDGWEIIGSGDFDGDGIDDVLLSDGTGLAGWKMANGQRVENQWFGNLSANQEIAGIADLNNDGTDDILILDTATEFYSGWLIKNGNINGAIIIA